MVYRAIGVPGNRSELIVAFGEFHENAGAWSCEIAANEKYALAPVGQTVNKFISEKGLQYQVAFITFHSLYSVQSGTGAVIAAETGLPVITDLQEIDAALGGNGKFFGSAAAKINLLLHTDKNEQAEIKKTACVAFNGYLRWREEYNFLSSITEAKRNSMGGDVWLGQEA